MSVAFTKEGDSEASAADLPDRPISPHPNFVTREGFAALEQALAAARSAYTAAQAAGDIGADRTAMARATRDLRYYGARRASAQLVDPAPEGGVIRFGSRVRLETEDGTPLSYRIVGEDEADPARGLVSYIAPMARALIGRSVGDTVTVAGRELEIVGVD